MEKFSLNILSFPVWWYTIGLKIIVQWTKKQYYFGLHRTGLLLFIKHLKEPLFGDYTKSGIVFSFFMRLVLLVFKLFIFSLRMIYAGAVVAFYFVLLPFSVAMIIIQLMPHA